MAEKCAESGVDKKRRKNVKRIDLNGSDWLCKEYVGEDWVWRDGEKRNTKDVRWWKAARCPAA